MESKLKPLGRAHPRGALIATGIRHRIGDMKSPSLSISGIDLRLHRGEIVGLLGASGVGKSTIARIMSGLLMPNVGGSVVCDGKPIEQPRSPVALVFQDYQNAVFPWLTVAKNIEIGYFARNGRDANPDIERIAKELDLKDLLGRYPYELSGGQRQRVQLARAIAQDPSFLVLDEPAASLDEVFKMQFGNFLAREKCRGTGILLVSHDLKDAIYLCDRLYLAKKDTNNNLRLEPGPGFGKKADSPKLALLDATFQKLYAEVSECLFDD